MNNDVVVFTFVSVNRIITEDSGTSRYCSVDKCLHQSLLVCHLTINLGVLKIKKDLVFCQKHFKKFMNDAKWSSRQLGFKDVKIK